MLQSFTKYLRLTLFFMGNRALLEKLTLHKRRPYSELFWSAFFPHFPAFGLNTGKYGKNADQNNSEYEHFLCSDSVVLKMLKYQITTAKIGLVSVYAMLCAIEFFSLQLYWNYHSSMDVFHIFLNCTNSAIAKSISYRNWYI